MNVHKYLAKITKIINNNKLIAQNVYFLSLTLHLKSTFSEVSLPKRHLYFSMIYKQHPFYHPHFFTQTP